MVLDRAALLDRRDLHGRAWCVANRTTVDAWLASLYDAALEGRTGRVALVAVGGYGRGDLAPGSDIDAVLLHDRRFDASAVADRLWYPIWDAGFHLGHKVATVAQVAALAKDDLDTATSLLSIRSIAGDAQLAEELRQVGEQQWRAGARRWLAALGERVEERHRSAADVAFTMEPDLKDGRGGMRDVHSLWWADAAQPLLTADDRRVLERAYDQLLAARVELHRATQRPANVLSVTDRVPVAEALGLPGPDDLVATIARAGRDVAWISDDAWRRLRRPSGRRRDAARNRALAPGIEARDGEVVLAPEAATTAGAVIRTAAAAAAADLPLSRAALGALSTAAAPITAWTPDLRDCLVELLRSGRPAIATIEALDHHDLWTTHVLPEWAPLRALPQQHALHRFTVDRHVLETVAHAAVLAQAGAVARPDLLVLGALLHDLGKGPTPSTDGVDPAVAGAELAHEVSRRLGLGDADAATVVGLVRHHRLLLDLATRRDLDDPATLALAADAAVDVDGLHLLAAIAQADAEATGPAAWTPWRAELLGRLVHRVAHLLETGAPPPLDGSDTEQLLALLQREERTCQTAGDTITVVTDDRPGTFSRIAGVLALHGLEVRSATALSTDTGLAASRFTVTDPMRGEPPWPRVRADVELALAGRLAIHARLAERAATYRRRRPRTPPPPTRVEFDDAASATATVLDVHTADAAAVLYRITSALAELDLDILSARVQTVGSEVVDAFYLRDRSGGRIEEPALRAEIALAVTHALRDTPSHTA